MKKIHLALVVFLLAGCTVSSKNATTQEEWRVADKDDAIDDWARFDSPNKIVDDFNGDGKADIAQILLKTKSPIGYKFTVDVSDDNRVQQFQLMESDEISPQSIAIELLKPSDEVWDSACYKGYWDCEPDEIRQFKITQPSIQFCYIESACTVFLWSSRKQGFIKIPISD